MEIIEPLELFQDHFEASVAGEVSDGQSVFSLLGKARNKMNKAKEAYLDACIACERMETTLSAIRSDSEKQEKAQKNLTSARNLSKQASDRYISSIEKVNQLWDEHDKVMPDVMLTLQQSYESRIHFLKYSLEKLGKLMMKTNQNEEKMYVDMNGTVGNVNSNIDIRLLVDSLRGKSLGVIRERFVPYEELKQKLALDKETRGSEDDFLILEGEEPDADRVLVSKVIRILFPVNPQSSDMEKLAEIGDRIEEIMSQTGEMLKNREGRTAFVEAVDAQRGWNPMGYDQIHRLAGLCIGLLTAIQTQNDRDAGVLLKLINLSEFVYSETRGKRQFLTQLISHHPIWSDFSRWQQIIEWAIGARLAGDRVSVERIRQRKQNSHGKGLFSAFKSLTNKIPTVFQREVNEDLAEKSAIFMVLSQFGLYLRNFEVPGDFACEVILSCSQRAKLDSDRVCILLAELQASQTHVKTVLSQVSETKKSVQRREKDRIYWNELLPLGYCLKYLERNELISMLFLNRKTAFLMQKPILQILVLDRKDITILRQKVWATILQGYSLNADYWTELQEVNNRPLPKELEDVIAIDVIRSFQYAPNTSKEALTNLLRAYAHFNPAVGYCQGMNYLFGTFFIVFQDEKTAFRCAVGLINRYQMTTLFYKQLPRLKVMFYQLDRIIAMFLPELHEVFRRETISASHFSSSWFMTLFSSSLQSNAEKFALLLEIWDQFVLVIRYAERLESDF